MRITSLLLLIVALHASARTFSQHVTFSGKDVPLEKIFDAVEKQTGYVVFYDYRQITGARPVTIQATNEPLTAFLTRCFQNQPFSFAIEDKTIMITKLPAVVGVNPNRPTIEPPLPADIHGRVTDSSGNPLAGASVAVKGSKNGTQTDANGNFDLKGINENTTLVISFTGFSSREYRLNGQTALTIVLIRSINPLDEVQIIAYGTTTKRLNTGDVTTVKAADIENQPVNNPLLALEGRVPGMFITQATGFPGTDVQIQLRGLNSLAHGNTPLFIIDGVPYAAEINDGLQLNIAVGYSNQNSTPANPFSYINPADIESIDVLKDADATAIYGSQGANGVVLVTTKKGKPGRLRIALNAQNGWGTLQKKLPVLNTRQYLDMRYEAFKNDGAVPKPGVDFDLTLWDTTRNTDWQKVLLGNTARTQDIAASISGGNANTQFLIGAGFRKETIVLPGDYNDQKGWVHFNIDNASVNKKFRISLSGLYTIDRNLLPNYDFTQQAIQLPPDAPPLYDKNGSINWAPGMSGTTSWSGFTPAALLLTTNKAVSHNLVSSSVLSYTLLPGLDIKTSLGFTNTPTSSIASIPLTFFDPAIRGARRRISLFVQSYIESWTVEPQLSYTRSIYKGMLTALAGMTILQTNYDGQYIRATGFSSDLLLSDLAAATATTLHAANSAYKYNAGFGRLGYNWQDKYLVNLTGRRDGSSRFGPASQFHDFWSVGAAGYFLTSSLSKRPFPL